MNKKVFNSLSVYIKRGGGKNKGKDVLWKMANVKKPPPLLLLGDRGEP